MEEKKGKRWNACWPDETDLTALKSLAHTFLYLEIQPTKMSPLVAEDIDYDRMPHKRTPYNLPRQEVDR